MAVEHRYQMPPEQLLDCLLDSDFLVARQQRFGGVGAPTVERTQLRAVVTSVRQLPLDQVPRAAHPFVGDGRVTQVDAWSLPAMAADTFMGNWRADLGTAPATVGGRQQIDRTADGAQLSVGIDVVVNVPLIGSKLASQVSTYLEELIEQEQTFLAEWANKL